jgi:hypothetical protein
MRTSRDASGVCSEAKGADGGGPTCQEAAVPRSGESSSRSEPIVKGGISDMAKKTAKGGKKKGGKKR